MDDPLLLKNTGTCLILCDSNGKPLPGQLSLSVSNDGPIPTVTVTFALVNKRVRLCGEEVETHAPLPEPFSWNLVASPRGKGQI
ncbi:TPA: hypothetical protein ONB34_000689 [Pseudomonas aeruginosa]|uniref:hypothetical protein n=1 Tax=Pseudomonas aeruginosa TaxID=287 RepID=UPI000F62360B|nr:hypothetical protein [Pseudomonas aeruginosa]RRI98693.1 hypothetical protein EIM06_06055 [Pseudomonas aeruginosa]HBO3869412.1 hypothetical protein [Pseudomonas aeruginosa]HCF6615872.1 hypothetical protein [Pseudomonas aeruginosa]HCL4191989.1 hypothetical protein [Pseudomonas aeruginosa]HCR1463583.1 hypothetical protein [Pseudomonas aeruginosa]